MDETKYYLVDSDSEEGGSRSPRRVSLRDHFHRNALFSKSSHWFRDPWKWATFIFAGVTAVLLVRLFWPRNNPLGSYEDGFVTDMVFENKIPLVTQRTHGRLRLYPNFTSYIAEPDLEADWPENLSYFGNPGPEEDKNWAVMMHDTHFMVTEEEAHRAWGDNYQRYKLEEANGGYQAELGVFHALHCLNWLRKSLNPDEYPHVAKERRDRGDGHTSHCLDILRQHVQCYGSTTLIPSQHSEVLGRPYTDSDQVYTCRDFSYLRTWTDAKKNADRKKVCTNGESIWGTRCDGFPGPVNPALWTIH